MPSTTPRSEARAFWKDIIYKDGKLDEEQVMKELEDFYFVMHEYPKVVDHITGGKMSKCMYYADDIIALADEHYQEMFSESA